MLVLIWACLVRGEPAGEDRPGGGPAAGAVRRDLWGLLVSEVVRGLKVPMGWSEGKDWALDTRLGGGSFCSGRKEELGLLWEGGPGLLPLAGAVAGVDRNMLRNSLRLRLFSWVLGLGLPSPPGLPVAEPTRQDCGRASSEPCLAALVPRLLEAAGGEEPGGELCRQVPSCRQRCVAPWNSVGPSDCALVASPLGRTLGLCGSGHGIGLRPAGVPPLQLR